MTTTLCCSYLRVYQPLDLFEPTQRERIERDIARPEARPAALGTGLNLIAADERREVYVKRVGGIVYACPAQTRLRTLMSLLSFDRSMPGGAVGLFFGEEEVSRARRELATMRSEVTVARLFLVQSPWHVPLRWFVAFDDTERRIEVSDDNARIRYETVMDKATERVARALEVLRGGIVHPGLSGMVYELGEWMSTFDERSIVELDYASVSKLFTSDELADDHTAADIASAIAALAAGDGLRAALYYQQAGERWQPARARGALN